MDLKEKVQESGVVGAGGAGFPAHVKIDTEVEYVIANGAECEPLIHKDGELMERFAEGVVEGLKLVMAATGAQNGIIGIKEKKARAVEALKRATSGTEIKIHLLDDYYPAGDEVMLVYEATGRLIPPGGIPLDIGVVVNNVESLYNIANATQDIPVISKFLTVTGAVKQPMTFVAPIGISLKEAIEIAGGATISEYAVLTDGPMMGRLEQNLDAPITKTMSGLIILPAKHHLVERKSRPAEIMNRIGKSACDQCRLCTDRCHRYLLGYDVQPHKVMRSLGYSESDNSFEHNSLLAPPFVKGAGGISSETNADYWRKWGYLCCECGLCSLYSCPEELYPKEACEASRRIFREKDIRWKGDDTQPAPHIMQEYRRTPLKLLVRHLGLAEYDQPAPFVEIDYSPQQVRLPLSQHIGSPAEPVVRVGEQVRKGQVVAEIPRGKLGARIHASIDGIVKSIDSEILIV